MHTPDQLKGPRGGGTFDALDTPRLNAQAGRVYDVMKDKQWRTLRQIADLTGDPESSVSARLRDLRKTRFGGMTVRRERQSLDGGGVWLYQISHAGTLEDN